VKTIKFLHLSLEKYVYTEWCRKADHHVVCKHNLHKLLLNNGFILVEHRCKEIESGDNKEYSLQYCSFYLFFVTSFMML